MCYEMALSENGGLGLGFRFITCTRLMSGKRIAIFNNNNTNNETEEESTSLLKKQCSEKLMDLNFQKSQIEALPYDILMKVLCGVDHEDLKQLFHVSKTIRQVTLITRKIHFEYSTLMKILVFRDLDEIGDLEEEIEALNSPKRLRHGRSMMMRERGRNLRISQWRYMFD